MQVGVAERHDHITAERTAILFAQHHAGLKRWLTRYTGEPNLAEDLAAQTFAELIRIDPDTPIERPWALLTTIARRLVCDHRRREKIERIYLADQLFSVGGWTFCGDREIEARDAWRMVEAMLGTLSPNTRAAFVYNQIDGLTYAEIGKRLGVSVSRVQQYLAKAFAACLTVVEL